MADLVYLTSASLECYSHIRRDVIINTEASARKCFVKKTFSKIPQNLQKTRRAGVSY